MTKRVLIGVSGCLLGLPVRYDGRDKRDEWICAHLAEGFQLEAICPEVAIGMGVPRPPIRLVADGGDTRARRVDDPAVDVTDRLQAYAAEVAGRLGDELAGYVFKSRSPSCGIRGVPRFSPAGEEAGDAAGIFAAALGALLPGLPVAEETELASAAGRLNFLAQVEAYARERGIGAADTTQVRTGVAE